LISVILITVYTITVAPPLTFMRVIWKSGAFLIATTSDHPLSASESENYLLRYGFLGRLIVKSLKAMPAEFQKYAVDQAAADRPKQYRFAIDQFMSSPVYGQGYGAINYKGSKNAHNIILEIPAEGGVIGGAVLISILYLTACCFSTMKRDERVLFSLGYFVLLTCTATVSGYWGGRTLLFGIGLSIGTWKSDESIDHGGDLPQGNASRNAL